MNTMLNPANSQHAMHNDSGPVTLRFHSIEHLGQFIKTQDGGYYTNIRMLTVKGAFPSEVVHNACTLYGAEVVENRHQ